MRCLDCGREGGPFCPSCRERASVAAVAARLHALPRVALGCGVPEGVPLPSERPSWLSADKAEARRFYLDGPHDKIVEAAAWLFGDSLREQAMAASPLIKSWWVGHEWISWPRTVAQHRPRLHEEPPPLLAGPPRVLVLDDFACEDQAPWVAPLVLSILRGRTDQRQLTVLLSNLPPETIGLRYGGGPVGQAIQEVLMGYRHVSFAAPAPRPTGAARRG